MWFSLFAFALLVAQIEATTYVRAFTAGTCSSPDFSTEQFDVADTRRICFEGLHLGRPMTYEGDQVLSFQLLCDSGTGVINVYATSSTCSETPIFSGDYACLSDSIWPVFEVSCHPFTTSPTPPTSLPTALPTPPTAVPSMSAPTAVPSMSAPTATPTVFPTQRPVTRRPTTRALGDVTCCLTANQEITELWINEMDMTSQVKGRLNEVDSTKTITFPEPSSRVALAIKGVEYQPRNAASVMVQCMSTSPGGPWNQPLSDDPAAWNTFIVRPDLVSFPTGWNLNTFPGNTPRQGLSGAADMSYTLGADCGAVDITHKVKPAQRRTSPNWVLRTEVGGARRRLDEEQGETTGQAWIDGMEYLVDGDKP